MMVSFFFAATALFISSVSATIYSDWQEALNELEARKTDWQNNGFSSYVYSLQTSCFCPQCTVAPKFVLIDAGAPVYVEFLTDSWVECDPMLIQSPLTDSFQSIADFYDQAIAFAQEGVDSCSSTTTTTTTSSPNDVIAIGPNPGGSAICGGSIQFEYDPSTYRPTLLSLNYGPFIADAGISFTFDCLSVFDGAGTGPDECADFVFPVAGDECGNVCTECKDGNSNSYGCCPSCNLQENRLGELMCSGFVDQADVCTYAFCGGIAGLPCPDGFICEDDPNDFCDPTNGGADCGGICVETDIEPCICTLQYDPVCCNGVTYGNDCQARCASACSGPITPGSCDIACEPGFALDETTNECVPACGGIAFCASYNDGCNSCSCGTNSGGLAACTKIGCPPTWTPMNECRSCIDGYALNTATKECEASVVTSCLCILEDDPVCCGGVTYRNRCEARCVCTGTITQGECKVSCNNNAGCDESHTCTRDPACNRRNPCNGPSKVCIRLGPECSAQADCKDGYSCYGNRNGNMGSCYAYQLP